MDYEFTLTGVMPLLMHADDVMENDKLTAWRKDPKNKNLSVPGDDRSPPWTWQTYLYSDGERVAIPQENLMAALRYAGTKVMLKGQTSFKSLTQSGLLVGSDYCDFLNAGKPVTIASVWSFRDESFAEHMRSARNLGFDLSVKRASVDKKKHVRVRAKFDDWQVRGTIAVSEAAITPDVLNQLFEIAGRLAGLGDWRPSAPKSPGPYGMFRAEVKPVKNGRKTA